MSHVEEYRELNAESVIDYLRARTFLKATDQVMAEEIGDGNLNYVFRVKNSETGESFIVKQALPYAKVVGESWPLTLDRSRIEREYLIKVADYIPHLVPKIYHGDNTYAVTVMEDLKDFEILRNGLIDGETYLHLGTDIGNYLAYTLFYTSDFGQPQTAKKAWVTQFSNPELCKITEDLIFTDPFFDHETNDFPEELKPAVERLWRDLEVKRITAKLKRKFLTDASALVHGDLHSGSIFINKETTKVIDSEFAYFGPLGFDIGLFFGNLVLNAISWSIRGQNSKVKELENVIHETWSVFTKTFKTLWLKDNVEPHATTPGVLDDLLEGILKDAVGFSGCEIIRRAIGLAHVADIDSLPDHYRLPAQEQALEVGKELIRKHESVSHIQDYFLLIKGVNTIV